MRPLLQQLQENLTTKKLKRFFPDPLDPTNPNGDTTRLSEMISSALWWLGMHQPIELVDSVTYSIPANGRLSFGAKQKSKVRKLLSVEQNDVFFEEVSTDWSSGEACLVGSWMMRHHQLYAVGLYTGFFPGQRGRSIYAPKQLSAGPITIYYLGIPTEADIIDIDDFVQAALDYALHTAIKSILTQSLRPKHIKMEGIPDITINVDDLQKMAKAHLESAKSVLSKTYIA